MPLPSCHPSDRRLLSPSPSGPSCRVPARKPLGSAVAPEGAPHRFGSRRSRCLSPNVVGFSESPKSGSTAIPTSDAPPHSKRALGAGLPTPPLARPKVSRSVSRIEANPNQRTKPRETCGPKPGGVRRPAPSARSSRWSRPTTAKISGAYAEALHTEPAV